MTEEVIGRLENIFGGLNLYFEVRSRRNRGHITFLVDREFRSLNSSIRSEVIDELCLRFVPASSTALEVPRLEGSASPLWSAKYSAK